MTKLSICLFVIYSSYYNYASVSFIKAIKLQP